MPHCLLEGKGEERVSLEELLDDADVASRVVDLEICETVFVCVDGHEAITLFASSMNR